MSSNYFRRAAEAEVANASLSKQQHSSLRDLSNLHRELDTRSVYTCRCPDCGNELYCYYEHDECEFGGGRGKVEHCEMCKYRTPEPGNIFDERE